MTGKLPNNFTFERDICNLFFGTLALARQAGLPGHPTRLDKPGHECEGMVDKCHRVDHLTTPVKMYAVKYHIDN
jgi:hypothetical protein